MFFCRIPAPLVKGAPTKTRLETSIEKFDSHLLLAVCLVVTSRYCIDLPRAVGRIKQLTSTPGTKKQVAQIQAESDQDATLEDLITLPLLRVFKYPELFEDILMHTDTAHSDHHALKHAQKSSDKLKRYIDASKRSHDAMARTPL